MRVEQGGGGPEGYGIDQVGDSQGLPRDEAGAIAWVGELPCDEGSGGADEDVAVSGGEREYCGEDAARLQDDECDAYDSPGLNVRQGARVQRQRELAESV